MKPILLLFALFLLSANAEAQLPRFDITSVFSIAGRGTVIDGKLRSGQLKTGDRLQHLDRNGLLGKAYVIQALHQGQQTVTEISQPGAYAITLQGADKADFTEKGELISADAEQRDFYMTSEDAFSITGVGTVATGKIYSGRITVGDNVEIIGKGYERLRSTVTKIEKNRKSINSAAAGESVGIFLRGIQVSKVGRDVSVVKPGTAPVGNYLTVNITATEDFTLTEDNRVRLFGQKGTSMGVTAHVLLGDGLASGTAGKVSKFSLFLPEANHYEVGETVRLTGRNGRFIATGRVVANGRGNVRRSAATRSQRMIRRQ